MYPIVTTLSGALAVISFSFVGNGFGLLLTLLFTGAFIYNIVSIFLVSVLHVILYLAMIVSIIITVNFFGLITLGIALVSTFLYYLHWNMMQSDQLMSGGNELFALWE